MLCEKCKSELIRISSKSDGFKGVCLNCELTYKMIDGEIETYSTTCHQLTEARILSIK